MDLHLYQQLRQGAPAAVPLRRALWRLVGPDRARYLNGQVTNDVSRLAVGKTLYAAVTSTKARMLGDVFIGAAPDALYVDAALELREILAPRLEKYLIADNAVWEDLTDDWTLTHLFGTEQPALPVTASAPSPEPKPESEQQTQPEPASVVSSVAAASRDSVIDTINQIDIAPPSDGVSAPAQDQEDDEDSAEVPTAENVPRLLANSRFGLKGWDLWQPNVSATSVSVPVPAEIIEALCIEHGLGQWGVDMNESNLPPESLLEARAISYTKGCYVGQEIIARVKSIGQVNKRLCVLRPVEALVTEQDILSSEAPETVLPARQAALRNATLSVGDREVGRITSVQFSPETGRLLCLGYVSRTVLPDAILSSSAGPAFTVISPPLTVAKI